MTGCAAAIWQASSELVAGNTPALTQAIATLLLERSQYVDTDSLGNHSRPNLHPELMARLFNAVSHGRPITIVLPAFPAKSANRSKTIGHLPDLGEIVALRYLEDLCRRIEALHSPGVRLIICSDGRVFNDLVGVSDVDVDAYRASLEEILIREGLAHLTIYDLEDHFGKVAFNLMRQALVDAYAEPYVLLKQKIAVDADRRSMWSGIHRFIFEDRLALHPHLSRNRIRNEAKAISYEVVQRSDAWSRLIAKQFPDAIRLSIHPHMRNTPKLGIKLVPGGSQWATPWHNCLVKDGGSLFLAKRADAIQQGATLKAYHGIYHYYEL